MLSQSRREPWPRCCQSLNKRNSRSFRIMERDCGTTLLHDSLIGRQVFVIILHAHGDRVLAGGDVCRGEIVIELARIREPGRRVASPSTRRHPANIPPS